MADEAMVKERAFLTAIAADPAPVHKLAYADWLEEHGRDDLAYAYRWAGRRGRHPGRSPKGRVWRWESFWAGTVIRRQPAPVLPVLVYDSLRPRRGRSAGYRVKTVAGAFVALAGALKVLREAVRIP